MHAYVRANPEVVGHLPHPDTEWLSGNVGLSQSEIMSLAKRDIIHRVRKGKNKAWVWRTDREAHHYLETTDTGGGKPDPRFVDDKENDPQCPECGRWSFTNARGCAGLQCKACGEISPKDDWKQGGESA